MTRKVLRGTPSPIRRLLPLLSATVLAALAFIGPPAGAQKPEQLSAPEQIEISARSVPFLKDKPEQTAFGRLTWLGTLELKSPARAFGGYSGLEIDAGGTKLVAVSDAGLWLTADIVMRNGRMQKLAKAVIGPLLGKDGEPLSGEKHTNDAEALAFVKPGAVTGEAYVGFEQRHRVGVYSFGGKKTGRLNRHLRLPDKVKSAGRNTGIEAVAALRGPHEGTVLVLTEEYFDDAGNHFGWLVGGKTPGQLTLKRHDGFAVTDAAALPDGGVIVLERRFRFSEGVKMRLRRVRAGDIRPGALLDGEVLLSIDDIYEIDNMEGLAVHTDRGGRTILTLISDDNFNRTFQRTLLMRFAIAD